MQKGLLDKNLFVTLQPILGIYQNHINKLIKV
jgi:hypothetical protein